MGYTGICRNGLRSKQGELRQERKKVKAMKKMIALLTAVMILAGSMEMAASAAVESETHEHNNIYRVEADTYSIKSTHPVWVANKPNGEPILATCNLTTTFQRYRYICSGCREEVGTGSEAISEKHSMTH